MHTRLALLVSTAALLLVQGCAAPYVPLRPYAVIPAGSPAPAAAPASQFGASNTSPAPAASAPAGPGGLSIGELLQMLQARRPQIEIASDIQARGLRVAPAPADFDVLAEAGASPELLQVLGASPAQAQAQVANGGVAPAGSTVPPAAVAAAIPLYDITYPLVPFGVGLGFGYYAGVAPYWGYVPHWTYPPFGYAAWRYTYAPRSFHSHPGRGLPRGAWRSRR